MICILFLKNCFSHNLTKNCSHHLIETEYTFGTFLYLQASASWAGLGCWDLPSALENIFKQSKPFKCITMQPLTRPWLRVTLTKCQSWWITPSTRVSDVDFQTILKWTETSSCPGGRKNAFINLKTYGCKSSGSKFKGWKVKEASLLKYMASCH